MAENVLELKNLRVKYELEEDTVEAVNGVNIQLKQGETLGLVGETGAGKTTTALSLLRLIDSPPGVMECDKMEICGEDVLGMNESELEHIRGTLVSMIFQDPMACLNPRQKVADIIAQGLDIHHRYHSQKERTEMVADILHKVGLAPEHANRYPHQFSGGMKQRVIIAIALACSPKLLIADEPTTALDVTVQAQIVKLLKRINQKKGTAILFISHDLSLVRRLCSRVIVMKDGRIVEQGAMEDIFENPQQEYTQKLIAAIPRCVKKNSGRSAKTEEAHG